MSSLAFCFPAHAKNKNMYNVKYDLYYLHRNFKNFVLIPTVHCVYVGCFKGSCEDEAMFRGSLQTEGGKFYGNPTN